MRRAAETALGRAVRSAFHQVESCPIGARTRSGEDEAGTKRKRLASVLQAASPRGINEAAAKHEAAGEQITPLRAFPERFSIGVIVAATFAARLGPALGLSPPH